MSKFQVFLSYLILFFASALPLTRFFVQDNFTGQFSYGAFAILSCYSFMGLLVHGLELTDREFLTWHYKLRMFVDTLVLPCYAADVWLRYGVLKRQVVALLYVLLASIPAMANFNSEGGSLDASRPFTDGAVYAYCTTTSVVCSENGSGLGVLGMTCFMIGYHIVRSNKFIFKECPEFWFNVFSTAFTICAFSSLRGYRRLRL